MYVCIYMYICIGYNRIPMGYPFHRSAHCSQPQQGWPADHAPPGDDPHRWPPVPTWLRHKKSEEEILRIKNTHTHICIHIYNRHICFPWWFSCQIINIVFGDGWKYIPWTWINPRISMKNRLVFQLWAEGPYRLSTGGILATQPQPSSLVGIIPYKVGPYPAITWFIANLAGVNYQF